MTKLKVEYFLDKCVGNRQCIYNDPKSFNFVNGKAAMKGSKKEKDAWTVTKGYSGSDLNNIINAAKSCPVNAIRVTDAGTGKDIVGSSVTFSKTFRKIKAEYDDMEEFVIDPAGYFLVRVDREKKLIEVGFCKKRNIMEIAATGKKAIDIYQTILREKIITRPDHAAYLGRELAKAEIALENNLEYVQDDKLVLKNK